MNKLLEIVKRHMLIEALVNLLENKKKKKNTKKKILLGSALAKKGRKKKSPSKKLFTSIKKIRKLTDL